MHRQCGHLPGISRIARQETHDHTDVRVASLCPVLRPMAGRSQAWSVGHIGPPVRLAMDVQAGHVFDTPPLMARYHVSGHER